MSKSILISIGLLLVLAIGGLALAQASNASMMPNIILIVTDDQRWDTIDVMPTVQNRLSAEGFTFNNAFVTTPLCCPSRASILTGIYAYRHGVRSNNGATNAQAFDDSRTLATRLQDSSDYRLGYFGKYMNGYLIDKPWMYIPPGWDEFRAFAHGRDPDYLLYYRYALNDNGTIAYYGTDPADYSTDVITEKALTFMSEPSNQPYFMYFAPYAPHKPFVPAPRHAGAFEGIDPWRPPNYDEADVSDKPVWFADVPPLDSAAVDADREDYLETLLAVDEAIADMLAVIEANNQKTIIIFTSDNGYALGEHGLVGKNCPYESCIRVPFIVWFPPVTDGATFDEMVLNVDIAPTIASIVLGATNPIIDGRDLLDLLDQNATWRDDILIEHWDTHATDPANLGGIIPDFRAVRNDSFKLVEYIDGELELYDLVNDPYELENIAYDPANEQIVNDLLDRVAELRPGWSPIPEG